MKNRRRKYLIMPAFQIRTVLTMTAVLTAFVFILLSLAFYIAAQYVPILEGRSVQKEFQEIYNLFAYQLSVMTVFVIFGSFSLGIIITHKIAGPLFAIERYLDKIIENSENLEDLKLRKGHELQSLVDKINKVKNKLR